ncbi:MAG: hypothetical protein HQ559_07980 [Lentisphaerae bacterium]|nr:hypothetical protein [Lentisphaerota bacterium]
MEDSLLSHIAGNFVSQYENVANSSVCYLLNRYPAARAALEGLLSLKQTPSHYVTEVSTKSNGRPDVTGLDANGNKAVIIEGKFWANLTDNQPANYLKELGDGGKLLFLAPDRRIESLRNEVRKRLGSEDERIDICSWLAFLKLIESENSKEHDGDLASDLVQLRALCARMDEEGMPPLSMTDLDPMNGRICYQLAGLIDDCNLLMREWDESNFAGTRTVGLREGYGFYFRAFGFGGMLRFSTSEWFTRKSNTPFWLKINDEESRNNERIYSDLNRHSPEHSYFENGEALYAIVLQPGMDRNQVVQFIVAEAKTVLRVLQSGAQVRRVEGV